jgi:ATP-binding protein involved in chromosome partitioning
MAEYRTAVKIHQAGSEYKESIIIEEWNVRIAIPTADGVLCPHFGNCQQFAFVDVDIDKKEIINIEMITPPPHQRGLLPAWINSQGCTLIIAGGMGMRANNMFQQSGIGVIAGAPPEKPEDLVMAYLEGTITGGSNPCDDPGFKSHGGHDCHNQKHRS